MIQTSKQWWCDVKNKGASREREREDIFFKLPSHDQEQNVMNKKNPANIAVFMKVTEESCKRAGRYDYGGALTLLRHARH